MARVDLRCACGYQFFVSADTLDQPGGIKCPRCRQKVGLEGPTAGALARPGVRILTAETDDTNKLKVILFFSAVGAAVVVAIVIAILLFGGRDKPAYVETPIPMPKSIDIKPMPITIPPETPKKTAQTPPKSSTNPGRPGVPGPTPPASAVGVPKPVEPSPIVLGDPLPPDLLREAREKILPLPPFYRALVLSPEERGRVEALLSTGRGQPEDVQFLQGVLLTDKVKVILDEISLVRENLARLDTDILQALPVDKILMNDGRTLNARIVEETPEAVKIERKLAGGVGGLMNLKREDIKQVQKGKGSGGEFSAKWESARKGTVAEQVSLMGWCKESGLTIQARLLAYLVLRADPGHPMARAEAGLPANPVRVAIEAASQGGMISYLGRNWTPKELKEKLLRDGNALINGEWYVRKERMISVPGLFRYDKQEDKPVTIMPEKAVVCHDAEQVWKVIQDFQTQQFKEMLELKLVRRFYAPPLTVVTKRDLTRSRDSYTKETRVEVDTGDPPPGTPLSGEVTISVPVGQPIIEAWVTTLAEVKGGGSITIYFLQEGERVRLYQCGAKEDGSHKLPDSVRGKMNVDLVAVIALTAAYIPKTEKRDVQGLKMDQKSRAVIQKEIDVIHDRQIPDYKAVLFPSNSNTIEVFRLMVMVGEPALALNQLFSRVGATDILKQ